jgi:hypothetical protein
MTWIPRPLALIAALALTATAAQAACVVEYKAKREGASLQLFFDRVQIPEPCTQANAQAQVRAMLAAQGIELLKVVSVRAQ